MRIMMLIVGAGALMAAAPPYPVPISAPAPRVPPPVFNATSVSETVHPPISVKVAIHMGSELLWSGALSVGAAPARFSLNEAVDLGGKCPLRIYTANSRSIAVTIYRQSARASEDGSLLNLNAIFSRPRDNKVCPIGKQQVSVDQLIPVGKGSVTVEGDGGFRVTVTQ